VRRQAAHRVDELARGSFEIEHAIVRLDLACVGDSFLRLGAESGLRLAENVVEQVRRVAPEADVLVVPSAAGSMDKDLQNQAMIDWVRQAGGRARHVVSLCDGAFVLAKAGLLDGVPATTFPDDYKRLAQTFPKVDLRINVSFVDAGKFLTSQGGARSYDVAMHLVDRLYGPEVAKGVGHGLLIPWPPDPRWVKSETAIPSLAAQPTPAPGEVE